MRYDAIFIVLALVCLIGGMGLGLWFFGPGDLSLLPTHVHLNLLGWATLALYGLIHRAYPPLATARLAPVQLWMAALGILLPIGFALPVELGHVVVVAIGGLGAALAPVLLLIMFAGKVALAPGKSS